jgi:DNA transformation protein
VAGVRDGAANPKPARRRAANDESFVEFVLEQLSDIGDLRARRMFGGHGLYRDDAFFGIVFDGHLYFKIAPGSKARYEAHGMQPFRPNTKQTLGRYYEVPAEVVEDASRLREWAEEALRVDDGSSADGRP